MYSFSNLKVCFVGVGSIASKHICNLIEVCKEENVNVTIDALRRISNRNESGAVMNAMEHVNCVYNDVNQLPDDYDVVFITNPTDMHIDTLKSVQNKGKHFFIEKPLISVSKIGEAESFRKQEGKVYYVACPMRYTDVLSYIKSNIKSDEVIGVRSISSSYLPDWRPETDYRKCYSAIKSLGGGVAIDLIHEWDYLTWLFDYPKSIKSIIAKKSRLEIDTEDYATYLAEYEDKIIELHLDYFGRKSMREIMIFTNDDTIVGDFIDNSVRYLKSNRVEHFASDSKEIGRRELRHFLNIIDNKLENDNDFIRAVKTLKLTQGVM